MTTRAFLKKVVNATRSEACVIAKNLCKGFENDTPARYGINKSKGGYTIYLYKKTIKPKKPRKPRNDKGVKRTKYKEYAPRSKPTVRMKTGAYTHSEEFKQKQNAKPKRVKIRKNQKLTFDETLAIVSRMNGRDIQKDEFLDKIKEYLITRAGFENANITIDTASFSISTPVSNE